MQTYSLDAVARLMAPVSTPIRNMTARVLGTGAVQPYKVVRALTRQREWDPDHATSPVLTLDDVMPVHRHLAIGDVITFDMHIDGSPFADIKSERVANVLRALMLREEQWLLNELIAQCGTGSGATVQALDGPLTPISVNHLLSGMWDTAYADPDVLFCNEQDLATLTRLVLEGGTPYYVIGKPEATPEKFLVNNFANPVTGSNLRVHAHPFLAQGTLLALSTKLPGWKCPEDIEHTWSLDVRQDYIEVDYPPIQAHPEWRIEVRLYGAVHVQLPLLQGVLTGIQN